MHEFVVSDEQLATRFDRVNPHLDERQRRVLAGSVARGLGRGGIAAVAEATGMSRSTVQGAVSQIDAGIEVSDRVRAPGGGRPRLTDTDPTLLDDLDRLVDPVVADRGRWVSRGEAADALGLRRVWSRTIWIGSLMTGCSRSTTGV